ncbi:MAG: preprotein translocase subunit Sec61beta [Candidatus Nanoarchaeia archaeon]|nr:preprotein translocase subunit Sec61beta [Candidatus Nanoarchaeia archaeon]MDD5588298.1 preprotein translocase subunit Sec61beta [Candidatus Nanoarchaeia archaeon]
MAEDKIQLPSSGGGLVRYFDEYKSRLSIKPMYIITFIIFIIILEIWLHKSKVFG